MRTSSDIDDTGRSGAGDWSQPSSVDLALDAGQMPADAGTAVDRRAKGGDLPDDPPLRTDTSLHRSAARDMGRDKKNRVEKDLLF